MNIRKVVVAVSGGVDSAVTALLLKRKGYEVHGVFMKNWDVVDETGICSSAQDAEDARWVCNHIGIPFHSVNFVKEYWHEVFTNLLIDYQTGSTPNPDILCNRQIKFKLFYNYALTKIGADAISTGHYAQTSFGCYLDNYNESRGVRLLKAADRFKDQTFFLSQVPQEPLQRTMFPLGTFTKTNVKSIAQAEGMTNIVKKKESMGICFIGSRNFQNFIAEYIKSEPGNFIDVDTGVIIGEHKGIHHWTIGQRCRIGGQRKPYFVVKKDAITHDILVANNTNHRSLFTKLIFTTQPHWIHSIPDTLRDDGILDCDFRFQHTKRLSRCAIYLASQNELIVRLQSPIRAITPGQYAVFYRGQECLGSARITNAGPSVYSLGCDTTHIAQDYDGKEVLI